MNSLWRDGRFVRYWVSSAVSQFGDRVSEVAVPLVAVTVLDASAGQVAVLTALAWTPNLLAVVLGAWVDGRARKRRLLVVMDLLRAGVLLSLPVTYLCGSVTLGQLYAVVLLGGLAGVVAGCAWQPLFTRIVPRSSYVDANSRFSAARSASFVAGPAVGGGLVQALGASVAVVVDALSFLVSALLLGGARVDEPAPAARSGAAVPALLRDAREGLLFVLRHPVLRAGLACTTTINFFTFLAGTGMVVLFADRELHLSPGAIGLTLGVGATGSLLGALTAPWLSRRVGVGRCVAVGAVLFPAPFALAAVAGGPAWAGVVLLGAAQFLVGLGVMWFDVPLNSLQAAVTPDALRSRVVGAYSTLNYGVRPLGAIAGGALATTVGLRTTLVVVAVGGVLSVLWLLPSPIPGIRRLTDTEEGPAAELAEDTATGSEGVRAA
ncbi:MFS transporter [Streptomyces griseorubiginosus]|uniref:MFS transporter n=1 Tax=Streptomyces griseorubiginosus TaxID=67304 RepID=UPI002E821581|nr:MFS transporter [Streptomyces griseorubiginosus]WUB43470.1 MFS transporter [Streptomyces griseorubiginosus]WUB51989.1 MFS transporter [Streptomyces griseorubiginosus]